MRLKILKLIKILNCLRQALRDYLRLINDRLDDSDCHSEPNDIEDRLSRLEARILMLENQRRELTVDILEAIENKAFTGAEEILYKNLVADAFEKLGGLSEVIARIGGKIPEINKQTDDLIEKSYAILMAKPKGQDPMDDRHILQGELAC